MLPLLPDGTPAEFLMFEKMALVDGGFLDAVVFSAIGFAFTLPVFLLFQDISALGWFCSGLATRGYLGLIAAMAYPPGPFMARVLRAVGSSLSIYLGLSVVLATISSGFGLDL